MNTQNYCMVNKESFVCDNVVVWDGNPDTWQPPAEYIMLPQATTPAKTWVWDDASNTWVLGVSGEGGIGFTWDGSYLITNQPQPTNPEADQQPTTTGTQTL